MSMINFLEKTAITTLSRTQQKFIRVYNEVAFNNYLHSNRRPWRWGYSVYKNKYLDSVLNDPTLLNFFLKSQLLPKNYGYRLDVRIVEIPWVLSRLNNPGGSILDAGSALNNEVTLSSPILKNKKISILTLAPESQCFWNLGISYIFGDLRNIDFKDNLFDSIVCISTIEHIGMDNTIYTNIESSPHQKDRYDFLAAIKEIKRVLKPGGKLFCTFPFGEYEDHGWFQQFDSNLADQLIAGFNPHDYRETVFRYNPDGWQLSDRTSCAHCQYFDIHSSKYFDPSSSTGYPPDCPAAERAVMCLELIK